MIPKMSLSLKPAPLDGSLAPSCGAEELFRGAFSKVVEPLAVFLLCFLALESISSGEFLPAGGADQVRGLDVG